MSSQEVTLKNNNKSPRGFYDSRGVCVVVQPGKQETVTLSEDGLKAVLKCGSFARVAAEPKPEPKQEQAAVQNRPKKSSGKGKP